MSHLHTPASMSLVKQSKSFLPRGPGRLEAPRKGRKVFQECLLLAGPGPGPFTMVQPQTHPTPDNSLALATLDQSVTLSEQPLSSLRLWLNEASGHLCVSISPTSAGGGPCIPQTINHPGPEPCDLGFSRERHQPQEGGSWLHWLRESET